jgi:hypothetical protein
MFNVKYCHLTSILKHNLMVAEFWHFERTESRIPSGFFMDLSTTTSLYLRVLRISLFSASKTVQHCVFVVFYHDNIKKFKNIMHVYLYNPEIKDGNPSYFAEKPVSNETWTSVKPPDKIVETSVSDVTSSANHLPSAPADSSNSSSARSPDAATAPGASTYPPQSSPVTPGHPIAISEPQFAPPEFFKVQAEPAVSHNAHSQMVVPEPQLDFSPFFKSGKVITAQAEPAVSPLSKSDDSAKLEGSAFVQSPSSKLFPPASSANAVSASSASSSLVSAEPTNHPNAAVFAASGSEIPLLASDSNKSSSSILEPKSSNASATPISDQTAFNVTDQTSFIANASFRSLPTGISFQSVSVAERKADGNETKPDFNFSHRKGDTGDSDSLVGKHLPSTEEKSGEINGFHLRQEGNGTNINSRTQADFQIGHRWEANGEAVDINTILPVSPLESRHENKNESDEEVGNHPSIGSKSDGSSSMKTNLRSGVLMGVNSTGSSKTINDSDEIYGMFSGLSYNSKLVSEVGENVHPAFGFGFSNKTKVEQQDEDEDSLFGFDPENKHGDKEDFEKGLNSRYLLTGNNFTVLENSTLTDNDYLKLFMHTEAAKNFFKGIQALLFHLN